MLLKYQIGAEKLKPPEALLKRKEAIHKALMYLEEVVRIQKKAVDAYRHNLDTFQDMKQEYGRLEVDFIDQLRKLWPEETQAIEQEINKELDKIRKGRFD